MGEGFGDTLLGQSVDHSPTHVFLIPALRNNEGLPLYGALLLLCCRAAARAKHLEIRPLKSGFGFELLRVPHEGHSTSHGGTATA